MTGILILAFVCMIVQDTLAALKAQAVNRNHGVVAGFLDNGTWLTSTIGVTIAAFTFHGHDTVRIVTLICVIFIANMFGNYSGTWLGKRFVIDEQDAGQDVAIKDLGADVDALLARVAALEGGAK